MTPEQVQKLEDDVERGMTPREREGQRLLRLEIENMLRVQALVVDAQGRNVVLHGDNGTGKTSAVDLLMAAFAPRDLNDRAKEPIHYGATKGRVRVELDDFIIERTWSASGPKLTVFGKDGLRVAKPQAVLDSLISQYSIDPASFLDLKAKDQVQAVLAICAVQPPVDAVEKLTGQRFEPADGQSADSFLEQVEQRYFDRRHDIGVRLKQKEAELSGRRMKLAELGGPANGEPVSVAELAKKLAALSKQSQERQAARQVADEADADLEENSAALEAIEDEEKLLVRQIEELQRKLTAVRARIDKGRAVVKQRAEHAEELRFAFAALPDVSGELASVQNQISVHETKNRSLAERQRMTKEVADLDAETRAIAAEHTKADAVISGVRELKKHLLDGHDLGVDGLEIGNGELRLNGKPFSQASESEAVSAACALAVRQNPKLKLLRIDNGERFGRRRRDLLFKFAAEHGYQVIMTAVSTDQELRVEIVDAPTEKEHGDEHPVELAGNGRRR